MNLYDLLLAAPFLGFVLLLLLPEDNIEGVKKTGLAISLLIFLISLFLIAPVLAAPSHYSFTTDVQWISYPNIRYHVGVDGVSLWLILLSTLLTPIAMLVSWRYIEQRQKLLLYFMLLL